MRVFVCVFNLHRNTKADPTTASGRVVDKGDPPVYTCHAKCGIEPILLQCCF